MSALLRAFQGRFASKWQVYAATATCESDELLLPSDEKHKRAIPGRNSMWLVSILNSVLFCVSVTIAALAVSRDRKLSTNTGNALIRKMDAYSPVHDLFELPLIDTKINGSLLYMDESIFRAPPSPEVDAAWARVADVTPHVISTAEVIKLGKDPAMTARWPEDYGFGPDAHIAEMDSMHSIHCLNAIRRDIHWRYYFKDKYPDGVFSELHQVHTDHCIHIVLQDLMCGATADMITLPWVEGQLHPFPDFSVNKKCRDYDALLNWHEENMVPDQARYDAIRKPADQVPYPMTVEFRRMFGLDEGSPSRHDAHDHDRR